MKEASRVNVTLRGREGNVMRQRDVRVASGVNVMWMDVVVVLAAAVVAADTAASVFVLMLLLFL